MTHAEFSQWLGYHSARFTGVTGWLAKFPARPRFEGDPTQVEIRDAWFDVLKHCELGDAKQASDALNRGDEELPKTFDDHPRYVRRIAGVIRGQRLQSAGRRRFIDGEETVKCRECQDAGNLQAWHSIAVKAARKGDLFHPTLNPDARGQPYTTCVRCNCDAGAAPKNTAYQAYNPEKHFLVSVGSTEDNWRRLMDDVAAVAASAETFNPDAWSEA